MRHPIIWIAFGLLFGACSESEGLCPAGACEPNGSCVVGSNGPTCDCNDFYTPCPGLTCCPVDPGLPGYECTDDADCRSGRCWKDFGNTEGYCTVLGCMADSECISHVPGETAEMCCVEVDADYFICLKIAEGYECGDGTGTCGTSCTGTLDSACAAGYPCMRSWDEDFYATCSKACEEPEDCRDCSHQLFPEAGANCSTISSGDKYCLFGIDSPCTSSTQCGEGETCSIGVSPDMTELFGECMNVGALPPGAACNDEDDPTDLIYDERCSGYYCLGDKCSGVCSEDADCPADMSCELLRFSNVDDEILVCMGDVTCDGPADCVAGFACWPTISGNGLDGWCRPNEGTDLVGTACGETNDTCEVFCLETLCTEWCSLDEDCPEGMGCETVDFCLIEPCDDPENTLPGTVCIGD
ncbi:MAG: hypothetical protein JRF33_05125 [Deltaproteobacteria bacterium]|nr:hypothetical protein [Deltaproteobacteria bacterium]